MKNNRLLVSIVALAMLASALPTLGKVSADADRTLTPVDEYFLDFVADDIGDNEITYSSAPLYNETLAVSGYEYTFAVNGVDGYALLQEVYVGENAFYEVEEMRYNGVSPFAESTGLPVYITFGLYLDYVDETLYNLATGAPVTEETLAWATEKRFGYFGGSDSYTSHTYSISYERRETDSYTMQYGFPAYTPSVGMSCANVAGTNVIGYYDRFFENLVPNAVTYYSFGGNLVYKGETAETEAVCASLHDLMGTSSSGTTFSGFNAGMASYVQQQGYSYSTTSVFSNGSFDFAKYKTAVQSGKPVALFLNNYGFYRGEETVANVDTIYTTASPNTHIAVGCGYKCNTYYNANNAVISTQRYLRISSGLALYGLCYLNISMYTTINNAVAITIQ